MKLSLICLLLSAVIGLISRLFAAPFWQDAGYNNNIAKPFLLFVSSHLVAIVFNVTSFLTLQKPLRKALFVSISTVGLVIVFVFQGFGMNQKIRHSYLDGWIQRVSKSNLDFAQIRSNFPKELNYSLTEHQSEILVENFKRLGPYGEPSVVVRKIHPSIIDFSYGGGFGGMTGLRIYENPKESMSLNFFNEQSKEIQPGIFAYIKL